MNSLTNSFFERLKNRWFSPPVFEDQDKTLMARSSFALAIVGITTSIFIFIFFLLFAPANLFRLLVIGASIFFSYLPIVFLRKGYVRAVIFFQASIIWIGVVSTSLSTGGVRSIGFIGGTIAALLFMGIALELKSTIFFIAISITAAGILAWAEARGYINTTAPIESPIVLVATYASFLFVLAGLLYVTYRNVTQALAKANRELIDRQSVEARLLGVFENSPDFILEIDRNGNILFTNRRKDEYEGTHVHKYLPSGSDKQVDEIIARAFETGEQTKFEIQMWEDDGSKQWYSVRVGPMLSEGKVDRLVVITTNIHAQKEAEVALSAREELYRLISTITADYVFSTQLEEDGQLHLNWVGGGFESITGYSLEEYVAIGGWRATLYPDDREVDAKDMASLQTNQNIISEVRTIHKNGDIRWVRVYAHPLWDAGQNRLIGIYGAVQDITDRKQADVERESFIRELEAKNAELERFTYTVSHELKSPLVTIKGFLGILKKDIEENKPEHVNKDIYRIAEAAEKMGILLSDLLDLSRIGRIVNPPEEVEMENLVRESLASLDGRLRPRKIAVNVLPGLPRIHGDHIRLREVFENLIDNAAKYMGDQPSPLIEIGTKKKENETLIYVKDNGMGISPQFHSKIFNLFEKLDPSTEGAGIGLAIIKRIIELHGGRIWVESEGLGKGSTFFFMVPVQKVNN